MPLSTHYRLLLSIMIGLGLGALSSSYPAQDRQVFTYPLGEASPSVKSAVLSEVTKTLATPDEMSAREKNHA